MNQKAFYLPETQVKKTLAVSPTIGKKLLEPLKEIAKNNNLPFNILEDHQLTANDAEVHQHEADLWLCLEGEVVFVCDGEMVEPWYKKLADNSEDRREVKAKFIRGGTTYVLKPGRCPASTHLCRHGPTRDHQNSSRQATPILTKIMNMLIWQMCLGL